MKVITGNPGTGKHTITKYIAKKLDLKVIDINKIAKNEKIFKKINGALEVDVDQLKKIINKLDLRDSILVGHLAPYVISQKKVELAIVLRKNPYKLRFTYKKRKYSSKKSLENLGSEILGVIYYDAVYAFGKKKIFQIDTSNDSITSTVKKIESIFTGSKIKEDQVDWLELILKKGDMKKFFPY